MGNVFEGLVAYRVLILEIVIGAVIILIIYNLIHISKKAVRAGKERCEGENTFLQGLSLSPMVYILLKRADWDVCYVSPNAEKILGMNENEIFRNVESLARVFAKNDIRRLKKETEKKDGGESFSLETDYKPVHSEEIRHGKIQIFPHVLEEYSLIAFIDITAEQNVRYELQEDLKREQIANRSKSEFLSKMSHEIRTPMNGILGMLALARMNLGRKEIVDDYLSKAEGLSQFLITLINDVLDMSRIESGKVELEQRKIDLFSISDKIQNMFQKSIEDKGVHFAIEMLDFDVRYLIGDELRLMQVIINFLSNAQKFTAAGGQITVTFKQMHKIEGNLHLMIRVRDTGKGMESAFMTRIFKPFEQESREIVKQYGGSGLGMAISDQLISLMGGQIVVDSQVGKGSDFSIYLALPIAEGEQQMPWEQNKQESQSSQKRETKPFELAGKHVLMAEDNDVNAEIAMEMLQSMGVSVERAVDGLEVVEKFRECMPGAYDFIFMDIQMPGQNGWDAAAQIRALDHPDAEKIPIFALSANAFIEDRRRSEEAGMNGHITKPIDFENLEKEISEML